MVDLRKISYLIIAIFLTFQGCGKVSKLYNNAIQEVNKGNYEEAIKIYNQILMIEKENPFYLNNLGWTYFRNDKFKEAIATLKKAKANCKTNDLMKSIETNLFMASTFQKGRELLQRESYKAAMEEFEKVVTKYQTKEIELKYFALCYEGLRKYEKAEENWKKILIIYDGSDINNNFYLLAKQKLNK